MLFLAQLDASQRRGEPTQGEQKGKLGEKAAVTTFNKGEDCRVLARSTSHYTPET